MFPALSVIVTVYGNVPFTVGVPEIVPLVDIVSPDGNPVALNVYGPPAPPLPTSVAGVIATPCTAVITTQVAVGGALTVTEQLNVPVLPLLSVIVTVYGNVPFTVGVPEIVPLVDIVNPDGNPVALNVYGPPAPPLPTRVAGVMGLPWTALIDAQLALGAAFTVIEQFSVPVFPALSVMVTVYG